MSVYIQRKGLFFWMTNHETNRKIKEKKKEREKNR